MAFILHFEEINGTKECVAITEEDQSEWEDLCPIGFRLSRSYEIEINSTGTLPLDRCLFPG